MGSSACVLEIRKSRNAGCKLGRGATTLRCRRGFAAASQVTPQGRHQHANASVGPTFHGLYTSSSRGSGCRYGGQMPLRRMAVADYKAVT